MIDPHKNYYSDWQTPPDWAAWVARCLGGEIDLDPCAATDSNLARVNYSSDGLSLPWSGSVYCNPPGDRRGGAQDWWSKAVDSLGIDCDGLLWCAYNIEQLRTLTPSPVKIAHTLVLPRRRIAFFRDGTAIKSPRNWTVFLLCGLCTKFDPSTPVACDRVLL